MSDQAAALPSALASTSASTSASTLNAAAHGAPQFNLVSHDLPARIHAALDAMRAGVPVILLDDFDRETKRT